jgi:hypothetical protein
VQLARPAPQDREAELDPQVPLDHPAQQAFKDLQVPQEPQVTPVRRVPRESLGLRAQQVPQGPRVLAPPARQEQLELQDPQVQQDLQGSLAQRVLLGPLE